MTGALIAPVVPPTAARGRDRRSASASSRRPPVPHLSSPRRRSAVYGLATIDHRGRIADLGSARALGWDTATRLDIRERGGPLLITATDQGVFSLTSRGHLRLPATVRRWCGLNTGDRVLLAADPDQQQLLVHPPAVAYGAGYRAGERAGQMDAAMELADLLGRHS